MREKVKDGGKVIVSDQDRRRRANRPRAARRPGWPHRKESNVHQHHRERNADEILHVPSASSAGAGPWLELECQMLPWRFCRSKAKAPNYNISMETEQGRGSGMGEGGEGEGGEGWYTRNA